MTEVKNTKITANVTSSSDSEQVEYVTFWGQLKGNLEKQTDLLKVLGDIKRSVSDLSTKYLRKQDKLTPGSNITIEKDSEDDLVISGATHTSQLINDGNGDASSEGLFIPFTTLPEVEEVLEPIKTDISALEESDAIINETLETKQNNLIAGDGIELVDDTISVKLGSVPGDGNLTIKKNGVAIGTFNANQATDTEVNIEVKELPNIESQYDGKFLGVKNQTWTMMNINNPVPEFNSGDNGKVLSIKDDQLTWDGLSDSVLHVTATLSNGTAEIDKNFFEISTAINNGKIVIVKLSQTGELMYLSKNRSYTEDDNMKLEFTFNNLEFNSNSEYSLIADYIILILTWNFSTSSMTSSFTRIPLTITRR